ncbi:DUF551 domain-containing protein [Yersinia pseudotuberculosis]|uniref:DUF551 domain-containing protein n=1 Tax=Yersinia pseudotuberculosis TaxID=633 RepID=UPI0005AD557B|nr:DUF551 domain-containing protein [Yersinia pseudotuberculosis]AJK18139.1 hypothetical protein BZ19_880 [Yersinia pseudotuberculosis str. PA3606]
MNNIEELKRFIYSATVTGGSGSQSFYIDAKNREEADKRAANNESDGMYADDSEVTDLAKLDYEDETTVDDFGDFPLISREQSLIDQLEAAQKELFDLHNQEFEQRLANAEHQLYMKDLAIHNIKASRMAQFRKRLKAEAALSAANERHGWIKCSDQTPKDSGRYWCYVEEQNCLGKSHYQWNCSWNGDMWSERELTGRVTHWMSLPTAPLVEGNADAE